tara:strand:+ start:689 stop:1279 length:591 start_codon:yes stop_codon:yes gene_type:complete
MIGKKIKNIELVTIALYELGGARKFIDTEDIAVRADGIDNERFKWRNKKYKFYIDKGLIIESLNAARVRKIGAFVKGNDKQGWILTTIGLEFCKLSKHKFNGKIIRKKRLSKIEKKYLLREENRIINTDAYKKFMGNGDKNITENDIKILFKVNDYTSKIDLDKRIIDLLDNFKDQDKIYQLINNYKKEVKKYVTK